MGRQHGMSFKGTPESAVYMQFPWLGPGYPYHHEDIGTEIDRQDFSVAASDMAIAKSIEQLGLKVLTEVVLGEVGWGKSTIIKVMCMALSALIMGNYEPVIDLHDKKLEHDVEVEEDDDPEAEPGPLKEFERAGEWLYVGRFLDNVSVDLANYRANCFDPLVVSKGHQILDIANETATFGNNGKQAPMEWNFHYQVAAYIMRRDYPPDMFCPDLFFRLLVNQTLEQVTDYLKDGFSSPVMGFEEYFADSVLAKLTPEEQEQRVIARARILPESINSFVGLSEADVHATAFRAALPFDRLIRGDFGHLLGNDSLAADLLTQTSSPTVRRFGRTYNWAGVNDQGRSFLRGLMFKFRTIDRQKAGGGNLSPDIEVEDEDHTNWNSRFYGRYRIEERKTGRQSNTHAVALSHRLGGYLTVGSAGSEERGLAKQFLEEATIKRIMKQRSSEQNREDLIRVWNLDPELVDLAVRQKVGESVRIIGELPPTRNALPLSEIDRQVSFTESALARTLERRRELIGAPHASPR